ncbi:MAG: 3-hydroxyacyl-ACP dehydratase FabZ family protein [Planctomycetota bacterium]
MASERAASPDDDRSALPGTGRTKAIRADCPAPLRAHGASTDRAAIESAIPHRDPFLFVDRIVARDATTIVTQWRVPTDLDLFRGHYPGQPILPGVILSEFVFQSGALLLSLPDSVNSGSVPVLARITDARFKRLVRPGDLVQADVTLEDSAANARYLSGKVTCDGALVARLTFTVAILDAQTQVAREHAP